MTTRPQYPSRPARRVPRHRDRALAITTAIVGGLTTAFAITVGALLFLR